MEILTLFAEFLLNFLAGGEDDENKGRNRAISILSFLFLVSGVVWLLLEAPYIGALEKPNLFVGLALLVCLLLSGALVFLLYKIGFLYSLTRSLRLLMVVALSLNFICLISFLNRSNDYKLMNSQGQKQSSLR